MLKDNNYNIIICKDDIVKQRKEIDDFVVSSQKKYRKGEITREEFRIQLKLLEDRLWELEEKYWKNK